ncbi:MAG: hypothetical protein Q8N63_04920 [Nanoarchaeota archaeon]|nr:hypothetical protein [Nanoarchaeota archaeon]
MANATLKTKKLTMRLIVNGKEEYSCFGELSSEERVNWRSQEGDNKTRTHLKNTLPDLKSFSASYKLLREVADIFFPENYTIETKFEQI